MRQKLSPQDAKRVAVIVVGFVLAGVFGIILIATGDPVPGGIIVAAAIVGLLSSANPSASNRLRARMGPAHQPRKPKDR